MQDCTILGLKVEVKSVSIVTALCREFRLFILFVVSITVQQGDRYWGSRLTPI